MTGGMNQGDGYYFSYFSSFSGGHSEALKGAVIANVEGVDTGSERVDIRLIDGGRLRLMRHQDCCETVTLVDFNGDPDDLRGAIIHSFEVSTSDAGDDVSESGTWTFYKLETSKGGVWMRWLGESNGYYSEAVTEEFDEGDLRLRVSDDGVVSAYSTDVSYGTTVTPLAQMEFSDTETLVHWATAVARLQ